MKEGKKREARSVENKGFKEENRLSSCQEIFMPRKLGLFVAVVGALLLVNANRVSPNIPVTWNGVGMILLLIGGLSLLGER